MNEKCLDDSTSLLEFKCKDNGIGMSQDFIKHAFDLFAQEDSSSRSTYQGTGLGLSIAKKLVEYMHGNIQLERVLELRFRFRFLLSWESQLKTKIIGINKYR